MEVGDLFSYSFSFSTHDFDVYASATGDSNPIHLNDEAAIGHGFKSRIAHGMLAGSIFSKILGTKWPGTGTIYLEQSMQFLEPIYPDTNYFAILEVVEVLPRNKVFLNTRIWNAEKDIILVDGKAKIKCPQKS
jgi:acyl dehydratase